MSSYNDIKEIRNRFRKLDQYGQSLILDMLKDEQNSSRTAKARAAIGKSGKRRGRKPKEPAPVAAVS
jgi:hypothetical protein